MNEEQIKQYSELLMIPAFLLKRDTLEACNEAARLLHLTYQDIAYDIDFKEEGISPVPFVILVKEEPYYYTIAGHKLPTEEDTWLITLTPNSSRSTLQEIYRVSTARQIMLQMANDFNYLDTDQSVYEFILENCAKAVECSDLCSFMLVEKNDVRIVAKRGYNDDVYNVTFEKDKTFLGMATNGKYDRAVIINDLTKFLDIYHTEIKTETHAQLLSSTLTCPIYIKKELFGILCFDSEEKNAFTQQDLELLELIKTNVETMLTSHQMQMEILRLSHTDMLTGLYNRTYLKEFLRKHAGETFTVGMFDMNDLKGINDGHGHNNGDLMIRTTAESLTNTFPGRSAFFRFGGDEFMCILYDISMEEIEQKIVSLRDTLNHSPIHLSDGAITTVSFSCGFALHEPNVDFDTVLSKADHHMYEEKRKLKMFRI